MREFENAARGMRRRRRASSTCTRCPITRSPRPTATRRSSFAWMSWSCSTCSRVRDGSGPRSAARVRNQAGRRVAGCAPPTPAPPGVRHLFAALELGEDKLNGHIKPRKTRARFLEFCRYLRSLYPPATRIAIICDNFSPHLTTRTDRRVGTWATAASVEIAYTPTNSSWLNRIPVNRPSARRHARVS